MDVPYVILADCERIVQGCVEALHAANELEAEGNIRKAASYRRRARRHADRAALILRALCGGSDPEPSHYTADS